MDNYIDEMRSLVEARFDELHDGVTEITLTDFPDHSNVGDSAIALGEIVYWRKRGIRLNRIYSGPDLPRKVYQETTPVAIHGGGNLGGLYPQMEAHRNLLATALPAETLLIQLPQSVVFVGETSRDAFAIALGQRPNARVAARDAHSYEELSGATKNLHLVPDAVHHLGKISSSAPTMDYLVLARTDKEAAQQLLSAGEADNRTDWPRGGFFERASRWAKYNRSAPEAMKPLLHKSSPRWERQAEKRVALGASILSPAATVVTDRLHAMLIALQMGRKVIAVDNNNQKLSHYAETWFSELSPQLDFASSFAAGLEMARRRLV